jgi:hypothetical protein
MVIVQLQGGLGNQMFQYACGKAFALKNKQPLFIDDSFLRQNQVTTNEFTPRHYELDIFNLNAEVVNEQLLQSFTTSTIYKKASKLLGFPLKKYHQEIPEQGAGQLNKVKPPVLLKGYWQSEQYFTGYEGQIRKAFNFNIPELLNGTIAQINATNSVSIHYRRGDYLTNPVAQKVLGTLSIDYYTVAIKNITEKIENPFFYIFSDDTAWVKSNLPVPENYQIIEGFSGDKHWYDMLLMSKCKHHIIANSSFSWWGAWLNPNPKKIVIAPKRWFSHEQMNASTNNLIPATWKRI